MEGVWLAMESIWPVVLIVMVVVGATVTHLGGVVLEPLLPQIGKRIAGSPQTPDRGEVALLRRELEASHEEVDRLDTLALRVNRLQEQMDFLERLLESEPRGCAERPGATGSFRHGDGDGSGGSGRSTGRRAAVP